MIICYHLPLFLPPSSVLPPLPPLPTHHHHDDGLQQSINECQVVDLLFVEAIAYAGRDKLAQTALANAQVTGLASQTIPNTHHH